jgi:hypothetical protein
VQVTISNVVPRTDTTGAILDAHDGKVIADPAGGGYLWYAASYGDCKEPAGPSGCAGAAPGSCGFRLDHNVSLFSSPDLSTWTAHGPVLQAAATGLGDAVLFCPKVLYNSATKTFVMWFNWIEGSDFSQSFYAVATAPAATGPFTVVVPKVTTLAFADTGDFNVFQDTDGTAYIIYTAHITGSGATHLMSVEQLTPDYLGSLGNKSSSGFFGAGFVEAPTLFRISDGVYGAAFGQCCCYCESGSPITLYTAPHPLGPWATQNVLGTGAGDAISAQSTDIFAWTDADGASRLMYIGDRWQSSPDGIKGSDFTYWYALNVTGPGSIAAMQDVANFTINI